MPETKIIYTARSSRLICRLHRFVIRPPFPSYRGTWANSALARIGSGTLVVLAPTE